MPGLSISRPANLTTYQAVQLPTEVHWTELLIEIERSFTSRGSQIWCWILKESLEMPKKYKVCHAEVLKVVEVQVGEADRSAREISKGEYSNQTGASWYK